MRSKMMESTEAIYYSGYRKEMTAFVPSGSKKILEIGCAEGNFLYQFHADDTELWGMEPETKAAEEAGKKLFKVLNYPVEEGINKLPDGYFDTIVMNDVLEHMLFPNDIVNQLKSKLTKNGVIVASIPNFRYIRSLFNIVVKRKWEYADHGILDRTHYRFFTKKSMIAMFESSEYKVVSIKGINKTKSIKFHLLSLLFSGLSFSNQLDMLFMQFAIVAKSDNKTDY
jgi:2-polyprenyl-3-methyl-5-hydroxy-6-metoxy-1,4-benzoquinol methylase